MATYKQYFNANGAILIEVNPAGGDTISPGGNLSNSMNMINDIVKVSSAGMNAINSDQKPQEFELFFGIKAVSGQDQFVVTQGNDKANFIIKVKWSDSGAGDLSALKPSL